MLSRLACSSLLRRPRTAGSLFNTSKASVLLRADLGRRHHAAVALASYHYSSTTSSSSRKQQQKPKLKTKFDLPDPTTIGNGVSSSTATSSPRPPPLTKIVATVGPASEQLDVLQQVVVSGMRIMRLNFSHATVEEVELRTSNLKKCLGLHSYLTSDFAHAEAVNLRAVLLDTRGPEIRTGKLQNDTSGKETISLVKGETILLRTDEEVKMRGSTKHELYIDYPHLHTAVQPKMKVLLDDGAILLRVIKVNTVVPSVECEICNSGTLRSRAGVNLPGAETSLPAMSNKDREDIRYGLQKDIDFIAASFIQNAQNVRDIRQYVEETAAELHLNGPLPLIISKIESMSALKHFDEILEASDGIMVARGDLGVELPIQQVTNAQKEMIAACNAVGKPVIVATQMLESMANSPRPTRAEVSDVTNAVYDGADCVMLSGETAKGHYPVESVRMMDEIIRSAEGYTQSGGIGAPPHNRVGQFQAPSTPNAAIAKAAVAAAAERGATAILVLATQGGLPPLLSAFRPDVPILVFCETAKMGRQLMLHRGVHPIVGLEGVPWEKRPEVAARDAKAMGFVQSGDDVVIVAMEDFYEGLERTATMKIAKVP